MLVAVIGLCLLPTKAQWNSATGYDEQILITAKKPWAVAGVNATGVAVTALGTGERTFKTIQAAIVAGAGNDEAIDLYDIPSWANGAKFTAIGITNEGDYDVEIRIGTLGVNVATAISTGTDDCNTEWLGTLEFIIGVQASTESTYEMAQSVVVVDGETAATWFSDGTVDGDRTCVAQIDLEGADILILSATTVDADSKLLVKFF